MSKKKDEKFKELGCFSNVIQHTDKNSKQKISTILKGYPKSILELGCGNGEYTVSLAKNDSSSLYIGVDIQGERLWHGVKQALNNKLENTCFIRHNIRYIDQFLPKNSIDTIWITFPDPFPRRKNVNKRLVSPVFLKKYRIVLQKNGELFLKTDDDNLFNYTLQSIELSKGKILEKYSDIYSPPSLPDEYSIKTKYEQKHIDAGKKIFLIRFSL